MPRIIEPRRRGAGGGTTGIRSGYQRIDDKDKPYWPEPAEATAQQQQEADHTTAPAQPSVTQDADKQAEIEAAKEAFQKRKPRKKRRSLLSSTGVPKPKQKGNQKTPTVIHGSSSSHPDRAHFPLVTPAASVASLGDIPTNLVAVARPEISSHDNLLAWESPNPHDTPQHSSTKQASIQIQENHQKELEALKEQHRLNMQEQIQNQKIMEEKLKLEAQEWKDKWGKQNTIIKEKESTIKELREEHALSNEAKDEQDANALREAVEEERIRTEATLQEKHAISNKAKDEQHANALKEAVEQERIQTVATLEENFAISNQEKEKHAHELKSAVEEERIRITALWGEDKQTHQLEVSSLREELKGKNAELEELQTEKFEAKQQKDAEEKDRKRMALEELEEATAFFSASEDASWSRLIRQYPLMARFMSQSPSGTVITAHTQSCLPPIRSLPSVVQSLPSTVQNPFRSSDGTFERARQEKIEQAPTSSEAVSEAASVLLELNNDVEATIPACEQQQYAKETTNAVKTEPTGGVNTEATNSGANSPKAIDERKTSDKKSPYKPLDIKNVPRSKTPPPPSRTSPRKSAAATRSSRKRLNEVIPSFTMPPGLGGEKIRLKRTKR